MNITVVGTGYVGLVTGTCFAETGNNVCCVDIDENKIRQLQSGIVPIYEPGLESFFQRNTQQGRLRFNTSLEEGIENSEIIFLALPTPPGEDGSADLSYILKVADDLSHLITDYKVIVDKSTVPVGTGEKVTQVLEQNLDHSLFDVVSNPEFLREGVAVNDFMKPDRVVIGAESERAIGVMKRLYEPFVRQGNPIYIMDTRSAEMTKYAANSYLATRISFMNEIANLCDKLGANVDMVRKGMGSDTRIGKRFLFPGVGYGGSCFPKDVQALAKASYDHNYEFSILKAVMSVNEKQKKLLSKRIAEKFDGVLKDKTIAIWGLAFKPNTDDIREAPALSIIDDLITEGATISAFDPEANDVVKKKYGDKITIADNMYEALNNADALAVITEWNVFRTPDFSLMKKIMKAPIVFDGRNVYDPKSMEEQKFDYTSIGRPKKS